MNVVGKFSKRAGLAFALAVGALWSGSAVRADVINLITNTSGTDVQGTLYTQTKLQPTGTGVFQPFLRLEGKANDTDHNSTTEEGFNSDSTDTSKLLDDLTSNKWVHSVKIDSIAAVKLKDYPGLYAAFLLDINESNDVRKQDLSLNKFQLFSTSDPNLVGYHALSKTTGGVGDGFGSNASKLFDMDVTGHDYSVLLDYSLNHGSGSGDLIMYVPYQYIQSEVGKNKYLVLYSSFGDADGSDQIASGSDAGFEEWAYYPGAPVPPPVPGSGVPLPSTAASGAVVLGLLGIRRRARK